MNQVTKTENTQLQTDVTDPFVAFGAMTASKNAPFMKFIKGDYVYGPDDEPLEIRTRLAPNMAELQYGFIKWHNGEPVDERMKRVVEGDLPERGESHMARVPC